MDDARERLGQPALQVQFGESIAMLTPAVETLVEATEIPGNVKHR